MSIVLEHLTKRYAGVPVVNDVSLEIADGEFFVLLGSSGSGKTTVLNMVAGLCGIDDGRILLHGRDVTRLVTQQRHVGFVFQNYALFQHMTVADNIEFGLTLRRMAPLERRRWRDELLELVGLVGFGQRNPRQLSGGQQQRVALARALAIRPEVLLLDEPLGALDAKIRVELRRTLRGIQRELGITTILVTHDQEEAFELADRLGVMSFGRLLEVGPPSVLYERPETEFVASFLGTANLLVGQATAEGVALGHVRIPLARPHPSRGETSVGTERAAGHPVQVLFRPEDVDLAAEADEVSCARLGSGEVEQIAFAGPYERLRVRLPALAGVRAIAPAVAFGNNAILVEAVRERERAEALPLAVGDRVWVGVRRIHALAHPGLRFLVLTDGSAASAAALSLAGHLARLAHARAVVLAHGLSDADATAHLQQAKELLGSGLAAVDTRATRDALPDAIARETEAQPCDLVILGQAAAGGVERAEAVLATGEHHVLLVTRPQEVPARALICVASGEPGKTDVRFAGRLLRHLGAGATILSVSRGSIDDAPDRARADRFLDQSARTMAALGVPARPVVRPGEVADVIVDEIGEGRHDLLVLGAPLPDLDGRIALRGVVAQVLRRGPGCAVLIVR
jgi:sulfate/thiosulfate transport system ATP-binding protein